MGLSELVDMSAANLQAAADVCLKGPSSSGPACSKEQIKTCVERVKVDASKVTLLWSDGKEPSVAEAEGAMGTFVRGAAALLLTLHSLTHGSGPSLQEDVKKAAQEVAGTCEQLIRALASATSIDDVRQIVGQVWAACDATLQVPLDNKSCLFKRFATCMLSMKDMLRELDEMVAVEAESSAAGEGEQAPAAAAGGRVDPGDFFTAASATEGTALLATVQEGGSRDVSPHATSTQPGAASTGDAPVAAALPSAVVPAGEREEQQAAVVAACKEGGEEGGAEDKGDDEGDDEDLDDEDGIDVLDFRSAPLAPLEVAVAAAARELVEVAGRCIKAISKALLEAGPLSGATANGADADVSSGADALEAWESCQFHVKTLRPAVEDLGASLYPPQDLDEIGQCGEAIANTLELLLDEAPTTATPVAAEAAAEQLPAALRAAVETALGHLKEALRRQELVEGEEGL